MLMENCCNDIDGKNEVFEEKPVTVPLFPLQMSRRPENESRHPRLEACETRLQFEDPEPCVRLQCKVTSEHNDTTGVSFLPD